MPCLLAVLADGSAEMLHARLASEAGITVALTPVRFLRVAELFHNMKAWKKKIFKRKYPG